jgi:hypothetical protein
VETYTTDQLWVQHGADIPVTFANGDQFGARARADGTVEVYRNGVLLDTRDVTAWPYYGNGGYIGLWFIYAGNATSDNFGGGTVTALPTPTSTATHTPTPTATATPTATPTATAPASGFPSTGVVDNFNRSNGGLGSGWSGLTANYGIASNQVDLGDDAGDIYWNGTAFGANQEVFVTLTNVDASGNEQDLLLKSQSSSGYTGGVIEVEYDASHHRIQVWTYTTSQGWVQRGADIAVTLVNGDQLGARATASGQVQVYRNSTLLGTRDVTAWPYYANGGYIGLWFIYAGNATLDNFGGGTY